MTDNKEHYLRTQKAKALPTVYSIHAPAVVNGKYSKSRTKGGFYVALPNTEASKSAAEPKDFS